MVYNIFDDLYEAFKYLPLGILGAIVIVLIFQMCNKNQRRLWTKSRIFFIFVFIVYVIATVQIAYFSREPGSRNSLDLVLFSTWGDDPLSRSYVVENVIMFLPLGILVPVIWKSMRHFHKCLFLSLICTVGIETMQLVTKRGYCQIDDVVMNTLGGMIGYGMFWLIYKVHSKIKGKK